MATVKKTLYKDEPHDQECNKKTLFQWILAAISLVFVFQSGNASAMSLNEYLGYVRTDGLQYKSQSENAEASEKQSRQADLVFAPSLFANAEFGNDAKEPSPKFYDSVETQAYSLGIEQNFSFGLQTKLSYQLLETKFNNVNPLMGASQYWDASPQLELTMPLWGGGFGRNDRANQSLLRSQNMAQKYNSEAASLNTLADAEAAYWKLSVAREVVKIQEQALKAAQNIHSYLAKKLNMNLGEKADVVQAQALLEARSLELQMSKNDERAALRDFNKFLNREPLATVEAMDSIDYARLEALEVPAVRTGFRPDVRAMQAETEVAKANAVLVREKHRPSLDLYGRYALNGRNGEMNEAMSTAGRTDYDTRIVGVRFKMPLHFGAVGDVKSGANQAVRASELSEEHALYMQEQDWAYLTQTLGEARENLKLITKIEGVQKSKIETERTRLRQGRTTTYQVLLFEQDYSSASINRVKSAGQILTLLTQIQLYQVSGGN